MTLPVCCVCVPPMGCVGVAAGDGVFPAGETKLNVAVQIACSMSSGVLAVGVEVLLTGVVGADSNLSLEWWSMSIAEKSSLKCRRFMLITTRSRLAPAAMASFATCRKEDWVIRV